MTKKCAVIDIETTGLDPDKCSILEVCIVITGRDLWPLAKLEFLVRHADIDAIYWDSDFVRKMHEDNGLLADLKSPTIRADVHEVKLEDVEKVIVGFLSKYNDGDPKSLYLTGSSVHFDKSFLERYAPKALDEVHYRLLDVTAVRLSMELETGIDFECPKKKKHRARDDVGDTMTEQRFLWESYDAWLASLVVVVKAPRRPKVDPYENVPG